MIIFRFKIVIFSNFCSKRRFTDCGYIEVVLTSTLPERLRTHKVFIKKTSVFILIIMFSIKSYVLDVY